MHIYEPDAKFFQALAEFDAAHARKVKISGCPHCGGPLDCGDYPRKPRGDLGEAADGYGTRTSFCCRVDGCRRRATPPSLRFLGRKVYVGVLVVVASVVGRRMQVGGGPRRIHGVPARTVRRWLAWWSTVLTLSHFWLEARAFFATPVDETTLPTSLIERFGGANREGLVRLLRFLSPLTTTSMRAGIAIGM